MMTKICSKCNIEKPTQEFNRSKRNSSGIRCECKACQKLSYQNKSEHYKALRKERYKNNTEKELQRNREYYKLNKNEIIEKLYFKKKENEFFRIICNLRSRISQFVKSRKLHKDNQTLVLLGIDLDNFKSYLESKFSVGMSWENYGEWHIDHIIPLSSTDNKDDLVRLCHYTNLQPLWAKDNLSKGSKIIL
jgi:hypothetical protein